ncbi:MULTISPECIES: hypothetical protein [unclassified Cupriavidus]|uniref:hypothetical protein n=1 Tax=unclassified Cupriavidus TaxID=2640874 RepID=UPI0010F71991|nr:MULTISPECIES: hypothetical protein [unclassified Cupriavidus]QWE98119.1 hypothetical protein KLP38_30080 [Cupriavidus sp. EM10]
MTANKSTTALELGWPRRRQETGYFSEVEALTDGIRLDAEFAKEPWLVLCQVSDSFLSEDSGMDARGVHAQAFRLGEAFPRAYVEFDLLSPCAGQTLEEWQFLDACDSASSALSSMAIALSQSAVQDVGRLLGSAPILHLSRIEVRADQQGQRLGEWLGQFMLRWLCSSFAPGLLVVQPFPLQFESCSPCEGTPAHAAFREELGAATAKLAGYYCRTLNVNAVREGDSHLIGALAGWRLLVDEFGWSLAPQKESE